MKTKITRPKIFRNKHRWYCVLWPLIGVGDTVRGAWVDFELKCFYWENS